MKIRLNFLSQTKDIKLEKDEQTLSVFKEEMEQFTKMPN